MELAELLLAARDTGTPKYFNEHNEEYEKQPLSELLSELEQYLLPEQLDQDIAIPPPRYHSYVAASPTVSTCSDDSSESVIVKPKNAGVVKTKRRNKRKKGKLWEFLKDILSKKETNPSIIKWEDEKNGIFRIVTSEKVAKLWGLQKGNPTMTYDKMSRALRYYYQQDILGKADRKRLVFHFGDST